MNRKGLISLKNIYTVAIYLLIGFLFQSCPNPDDELVQDCVSDLNRFEFYFMGENSFDIRHYDKIISSDENATLDPIPVYGTAYLTFKEDSTFIMDIEFLCDSTYSPVPLCTLQDYMAEELNFSISGTWRFQQSFMTFPYSNPRDGYESYRNIMGFCYMDILESFDSTQVGNTLNMHIQISCSLDNKYYRDYILETSMPIFLKDALYLNFVKQE